MQHQPFSYSFTGSACLKRSHTNSPQTILFSIHTQNPSSVASYVLCPLATPCLRHTSLPGQVSSKTSGHAIRLRGLTMHSVTAKRKLTDKPVKLWGKVLHPLPPTTTYTGLLPPPNTWGYGQHATGPVLAYATRKRATGHTPPLHHKPCTCPRGHPLLSYSPEQALARCIHIGLPKQLYSHHPAKANEAFTPPASSQARQATASPAEKH
eukprot:1155656-Pelagomonas_calceolata.AAC.5